MPLGRKPLTIAVVLCIQIRSVNVNTKAAATERLLIAITETTTDGTIHETTSNSCAAAAT